jgi:hypothetical protein
MARLSRLMKPKWELYDINDNIEHELFEDYIVEYTDIAGIKIDYYCREDNRINVDYLYGEPLHQHLIYSNPHRTKFIYEPTEEPTMTTPFGIYSEDMVQFAYIPKFTFSRDVSASYVPKPGDVVKTLWNNRNYEVVDVGEEDKIFQLDKKIWEFILKPYRFSEQSDDAKDIVNFTRRDEFGNQYDPSSLTTPLSAFGDNALTYDVTDNDTEPNDWNVEEIEEESDEIHDYDVDTSIYGY